MNNQASQLETEPKLYKNELTEKIKALEGDFVNKVEFLDSKRRSFEEDVKTQGNSKTLLNYDTPALRGKGQPSKQSML